MKENEKLLDNNSNLLDKEGFNKQKEVDLDKKKMDSALDKLIKTYIFILF